MIGGLIGSVVVMAILSAVITVLGHAGQISSYMNDRAQLAENIVKARVVLRSNSSCNKNFKDRAVVSNAVDLDKLESIKTTYDAFGVPITQFVTLLQKNNPKDAIKVTKLQLQIGPKLDSYRYLANFIVSYGPRGDFNVPLGVVLNGGKVVSCFKSVNDILDTDPEPPADCSDPDNSGLPECEGS